jgi:glycosyltransferase involved in cell wall biosynthesis
VLLHFGFEEYTCELANGLVEFVDITLIHPESLSPKCQPLLDERVRIRTFPKPRMRELRNIQAMRAMLRLIDEIQPDVLHVQETNDPWYDLTLLFSRKMPALVTTIHDVFRHPGDWNFWWGRGNRENQTLMGSEYTKRISFYRSQALIVHAQALKKALVEDFRIPEAKVTVLPHGELGNYYLRQVSTPQVAKREQNTILFFGRILEYKGLRHLLEAMPLVAEVIPEIKLIVAGRGENLEKYFPDGYDPARYEIYNEYISPEAVAELFQRSSLTVLPYIEASQSGVAALAYGLGTPVIASEVGGLQEIVRHERDGWLVPPCDVESLADAIIRLLRDRDLSQRLQAAALARCQEDLHWQNIASRTVDVYRQAVLQNEVK